MTLRMSPSGTQYRLARALLDHLTGLDPSAVGLVQILVSLIPRRRSSQHHGSDGREPCGKIVHS